MNIKKIIKLFLGIGAIAFAFGQINAMDKNYYASEALDSVFSPFLVVPALWNSTYNLAKKVATHPAALGLTGGLLGSFIGAKIALWNSNAQFKQLLELNAKSQNGASSKHRRGFRKSGNRIIINTGNSVKTDSMQQKDQENSDSFMQEIKTSLEKLSETVVLNFSGLNKFIVDSTLDHDKLEQQVNTNNSDLKKATEETQKKIDLSAMKTEQTIAQMMHAYIGAIEKSFNSSLEKNQKETNSGFSRIHEAINRVRNNQSFFRKYFNRFLKSQGLRDQSFQDYAQEVINSVNSGLQITNGMFENLMYEEKLAKVNYFGEEQKVCVLCTNEKRDEILNQQLAKIDEELETIKKSKLQTTGNDQRNKVLEQLLTDVDTKINEIKESSQQTIAGYEKARENDVKMVLLQRQKSFPAGLLAKTNQFKKNHSKNDQRYLTS